MKVNCASSAFGDTRPEQECQPPMFSLLIHLTNDGPEFIPICNSDEEEKKIQTIIQKIEDVLKDV